MLAAVIRNGKTKIEWFNDRLFKGFPRFAENRNVLATADFVGSYGRFASATRTGAGTTAVVTPSSGGSIILTDLLISGEKQAGSSVEVRFTDGTNTATIFLISQVDVPAQVAHTFRARVQGWVDARIDMITVGTADATVSLGYVKVDFGVPFAEWDALR